MAVEPALPSSHGVLSYVAYTHTSSDYDSDATVDITSIGDAVSGDSDSDADVAPTAAGAASRGSSSGPSWGSDGDESCDDPFSEMCPLEPSAVIPPGSGREHADAPVRLS